jgi:hypothetical protein
VIECGPKRDVGWNGFLGELDVSVSSDKLVEVTKYVDR